MNSKAVLRRLAEDGWVLRRVTGIHHQFRHPTKPGVVTVPHPKRDLPAGTVRSIEKQAGPEAQVIMRHYIGIVHKDPSSDFGVSLPDFPGCVSAGDTLAEAAALAREALLAHIELMAEGGELIPEPMTLEAALADPDFGGGVPILVPLPDDRETSKAA